MADGVRRYGRQATVNGGEDVKLTWLGDHTFWLTSEALLLIA